MQAADQQSYEYQGALSEQDALYIKSLLKLDEGIASQHNVDILRNLLVGQREDFAYLTRTMVLYLGEEVTAVRSAEEYAALQCIPAGHGLHDLNGINIGCGDREVSKYIQPVDIMRRPPPGEQVAGVHHALTEHAILALPDQLPFNNETLDFIIALHMLEHVENPTRIVNYWIDLIKPGGGIGIVVPDWRFTWDSRHDDAPFGHKWNPTPNLMHSLYKQHWADRTELEHINTYDFKLSFDIVLRKHGEFRPFHIPAPSFLKSGRQREEEGIFLHGE